MHCERAVCAPPPDTACCVRVTVRAQLDARKCPSAAAFASLVQVLATVLVQDTVHLMVYRPHEMAGCPVAGRLMQQEAFVALRNAHEQGYVRGVSVSGRAVHCMYKEPPPGMQFFAPGTIPKRFKRYRDEDASAWNNYRS